MSEAIRTRHFWLLFAVYLFTGLGSFLVSQERSYDNGSTQGPEAIIASHAPQGESDRDHMMLALANYEQ